MVLTRIYPSAFPFADAPEGGECFAQGRWPAWWLATPEAERAAETWFHLPLTLDKPLTARIHAAADERFEIYLDDIALARGGESGMPSFWPSHSYDAGFPSGTHDLRIRVFSWGLDNVYGPCGRESRRGAFVLAAEGAANATLGTGVAGWRVADAPVVVAPGDATPRLTLTDARPSASGREWREPVRLERARSAAAANEYLPQPLLAPGGLPEPVARIVRPVVVSERSDAGAERLADGGAWTVPPGARVGALFFFPEYVCAWTFLRVDGGTGGRVELRWAESLYDDHARADKGRRDAVGQKTFVGHGDVFLPNGAKDQWFAPPCWRAGRFAELTVETADEPLTLRDFRVEETHYPIAAASSFGSADSRQTRILPLLRRTLEMCSHDVWMDCPYYERLMYAGDARVEQLAFFVADGDTRLNRRALELFAASRAPSGLTLSRAPSRASQIIPPYALLFVGMLHDYARWRDDPETARRHLPRAREVLTAFERWLDADGLPRRPEGWNFIDWTREWSRFGVPVDDGTGLSAPLTFQYLAALRQLGELEAAFGRPAWAEEWTARARAGFAAAERAFWDEGRGLYADAPDHARFSEHAQVTALACGFVAPERARRLADGLERATDLSRTTVYFSHYLFEAAHTLSRPALFYPKLDYWYALPEQGFATVPERPEPSRSDCHAWGAHPWYHFFATQLGVRPDSFGFGSVEVTPLLPGPLPMAGVLPHPRGEIAVNIDEAEARITLPDGVTGHFRFKENTRELQPGENRLPGPFPCASR